MCCSWWNSKLWLQNSELKVLGVCSVMSFLGAFFSIYIGGFWCISWSSLCSHVCVIQCSTKNSHISCNVTIVCNVSLDGKAFLGIQGKLSPAGCVLVRKAFVIWNSWMLPPSRVSQPWDTADTQFIRGHLTKWLPELGPLSCSWVSEGMVVLVKCYSGFLQSSITWARPESSYLIFIFSLHDLSLKLI